MENQKKPRGRPFQPGDPRAGRPKGARNKATRDVKALCSTLVDDPAYLRKLRDRLLRGRIPPAVECLIWHYAKGKPKDTVKIEGGIPPFVLKLDDSHD